MRNDPRLDQFALQVIPGLESVAVDEWTLCSGGTGKARVLWGHRRNSTILLPRLPDSSDLFSLRTAEDIFLVLGRVDEVPPGLKGLAAIERAAKQPDRVAAGLAMVQGIRPRSFQRKVLYRLVTRDDGSADFTRHAMARHVHRALQKLTHPRWEDGGEGAPVELWLLLHQRTFLYLLRLTDRSFRHRKYKSAHLPGSLRPTLAAAMVFLTGPKPGDRFVDPMCGAGTVAIERLLWGPARHVIGGDLDPDALGDCRENSAGLRPAPDWVRWDTGALPFPDYSVDKVASNLPFGEKHGAGENIPGLYGKVASEVGRVLRPGGKAVFLTSRKRTLRRFLNEKTHLHLERSIEVRVLGKRAWMLVCMKR